MVGIQAETEQNALQELKTQNAKLKIIAIEQDKRSIPYTEANYEFPIALVVGHETDGVSKEVLDMADQIVEIPMWGVNTSLNVMASLGIVLFEAVKHLPSSQSSNLRLMWNTLF